MAMNDNDFRAGMRRLAAGVCLITTATEHGTWSGMTATAVCSVSADPPTLVCCINRTAASCVSIRQSGRFGVNVLSVHDQHLADRFSGRVPSAEKFAEGMWRRSPEGTPLLETAMAAFDCRLSHTADLGTHGVMFGEIVAIHLHPIDRMPLLYAQGAYGSFATVQAALEAERGRAGPSAMA